MLSDIIQHVGADAGDGYNRVDVFLLCREGEFDGERTGPFVVQFLHGAVGGVVLEA